MKGHAKAVDEFSEKMHLITMKRPADIRTQCQLSELLNWRWLPIKIFHRFFFSIKISVELLENYVAPSYIIK